MVLVFAESQKGKFKKSAYEAVSYGYKTARLMGLDCAALVLGAVDNGGDLGRFGAARVFQVGHENLQEFDSQVYSAVIAGAAEQLGAKVVVLSHSATGKSLLGRLAVRLKAGSVSGVNAVPVVENGSFRVKKPVFSGKAFADYEISSPVKVISLMNNAIQPEAVAEAVAVENLELPVPQSRVRVLEVSRVEGRTPLPEAEVVVSGGRGLKGPENWGIIEDLAEIIGATTACSRPVADTGWRPHHEHVGQTGITIRPNLYIAVGISGAIQHLAGVNNSKTIVVINKDADAPFFKAADYGVVGDLFEIVPRLTEAFRKLRAEQD